MISQPRATGNRGASLSWLNVLIRSRSAECAQVSPNGDDCDKGYVVVKGDDEEFAGRRSVKELYQNLSHLLSLLQRQEMVGVRNHLQLSVWELLLEALGTG